jgi:peroxiredoxin
MKLVVLVVLAACHSAQPQPPAPPPPAPPAPAVVELRDQTAWLGVRFEPGTTHVVQVVDQSPAAAAGIHVDDQIVSLDGVAMQTSQQIVKTVGETPPGTRVKVVLTRGGAQQTLSIKLAVRPPDDKLIRTSLLDKPAPPFTARALDGTAGTTLADLRGRVVLIDFWATWCGPCTTQFPHLNQWHQQYAAKGLHILGLSDEEADLVREYVAAEKLQYPIALDPDDRIRAAYFVPGMPTTVVIDKTGVVRYVSVGTVDPAEIETAFTRLLQ